ncbi:hypothetical protein DQ04_17451000, partial [Trypanosoma grayi]|uniref:hypothetical protein n=1 Tax=Trypanosoma grayi TaxID=71804 RepID=UPI0004F44395
AAGGSGFRKQRLATNSETVELDRSGAGTANAVLSTTHAINAEDIIPDVVEEQVHGSGHGFNAFDATAHHYQRQRQQRQKQPRNRATGARGRTGQSDATTNAPTTTTTTVPAAAAAREWGGNAAAAPPTVARRKKARDDPVNIFDLDALF